MKILLTQNAFYIPSHGGVPKANRILLEQLTQKGYLCHAVVPAIGPHGPKTEAQFQNEILSRGIPFQSISPDAYIYKNCGVEVHAVISRHRLSNYLANQVNDYKPDLILVSSEDQMQVLSETALETGNVPVIYIAHTLQYLPFGPKVFLKNETKKDLFRQFSGIISVSNYLREYIRDWSGLDSKVIPFPVYGSEPAPYLGKYENEYITIVNPCDYKGIAIFLKLVKRFPELKFLAVTGWGTTAADRIAMEQFPNVVICKSTDDIDRFFSKTRVLLMPSLWDESFGLLVVEAMARGIPVLSSNSGGLMEAKLGIDYTIPVHQIEKYESSFDERGLPRPVIPDQNTGMWEASLKELLSSYERYHQLSVASRKAAQTFISKISIDAFDDYLKDITAKFAASKPTFPSLPKAPQTETVSFSYSSNLMESLLKLGQDESVSFSIVLLSSVITLLSRYSNEPDICIECKIPDSASSEAEKGSGISNSSVMLRLDLSEPTSFSDLLKNVQKIICNVDKSDSPLLDEYLERFRSEETRSFIFLFQSVSMFGNSDITTAEPFPLKPNTIQIITEKSKFQSSLSIVAEKRLQGNFKYSGNAFSVNMLQQMTGHFETLLLGIVADPWRNISNLSILTKSEQSQILKEWNNTKKTFPENANINHLFEDRVKCNPNAIAITFENHQITYQELNRLSNQLARYLCKSGVSPNKIIGICLDRSPEMVIGQLATLKAGGAFIPLDPHYPTDRLSFMLSDSCASVLITNNQQIKNFKGYTGDVIYIDKDHDKYSYESEQDLEIQISPDQLAYIIYTSGSTGKPKGVMIPHRGLYNTAQSQRELLRIHSSDRILQFASFSFDASIAEIVMSLCAGATLCMAKQEDLLPGPDFIHLLASLKITMVTLPPSALAVIPESQLPDLRILAVAGEACPPELVEYWSRDRKFLNLYGPTESSIWATMAECQGGKDRPPIGRPICNTYTYILDSNFQPVPVGIPGELFIGGDGLALGYLNQSVVTAERFIKNPIKYNPDFQEVLNEINSTIPENLYKTGDLVRYRADGNLEFLGRVDNQVKVRGFRIEVEEIEFLLLKHPAIRQAAVHFWNNQQGAKRLIGYVVVKQDQLVTSRELKSYLKRSLPDFMVPSMFIFLNSLPLTLNGKINRRALLEPDPKLEREEPGELVAPGTHTEEILVAVWSELLNINSISVTDNFFDLGGDSLLAINLVTRLRDIFKIELSLRTIFDALSVSELADYIDKVLIE